MGKHVDEQAIRNLYATWRQAMQQEDLAVVLELVADDAVFLVPGQPPVRGKQQFTELFEAARGQFRIEFQSEFEEISLHEDWAYVTSRLAVALTPKAGGATVQRAGHTLTILRKSGDGRWAVARDANLLAPDLTPTTQARGMRG
jgi:uncharacterized protein (TIGR02246 family)